MNLHKAALLGYYFAFATLFAFLVPPCEAPDEPAHLNYVNFVATRHELPNQYLQGSTVASEGNQPPLYYLLGAAIVTALTDDASVDITPVPNRRHVWNGGDAAAVPFFKHLSNTIFRAKSDYYAFYALRMFSVLLGLGTLFFVMRTAELFPAVDGWQLLPAVLVATTPQFLFISATITNDNLANLLAAAAISFALTLISAPFDQRSYLLLGGALGLGVCAKKTMLALVPAVGLLLVYLLWKHRTDARAIARRAAGLGIVAAVCAGGFLVRNLVVYGELLGSRMEKVNVPDMVDEKSLLSPYFLRPFLPGLLKSFVGDFDWMNLELPTWVYAFYLALLAGALLGLILAARRGLPGRPRLAFALSVIAFSFAGIVYFNLTFTQYQGRYLFPVISAVAVVVATGVGGLVGALKRPRARAAVLYALLVALLLIDLTSVLYLHIFFDRFEQYA